MIGDFMMSSRKLPLVISTGIVCVVVLLFIYKHATEMRGVPICECRKTSDLPKGSQAQEINGIIDQANVESMPLSKIDGRGFFNMKSKFLDQVMEGLTGNTVSAFDSRVVDVLRKYVIDLPSPYISKMSNLLFKTRQAEAVDKLLKEKKNGFFVECGALDGERSSNTIFFEQKRNWTGLLVEMDPSWYLQLLGKNRKAYSINACISIYDYPVKMPIKVHRMGKGKLVVGDNSGRASQQVYCFPFVSMMLALNTTHIDYFSLDVEGFELEILKTLPLHLIDISVLTVEQRHDKHGEKAFVDFMKSKGFFKHSRLVASQKDIWYGCNDLVFVKEGLELK